MEIIIHILQFFLHLDDHLTQLVQNYGAWTYLILFLIVFCETGLVVTPFLPGDSLLFAAGAIAALGNLDVFGLWLLLVVAAIAGDALNYFIGSRFGNFILNHPKIPFIKPSYIERTQKFYGRYGNVTIFLARFIPIVRTFAPFLAGVGHMPYLKFAVYNVVGALVWVTLFLGAGYFFGNLPQVKENFSWVILGIIVISFVPVIWEFFKSRK